MTPTNTTNRTFAEDKKAQEAKLIASLKPETPHKEKADACRQLAVIGTKDAVPALAALLPDEKLSHMARYALEPIPDPAVDEALRAALGKLKGRPLVGVAVSLGVRRDAKAAGALAGLLGDPDADVVAAAARSLGRIATPEAVKALGEKMPSAPPAVRRAVADACLICAENLAAGGKAADAAALRGAVAKADLPEHFRTAVK